MKVLRVIILALVAIALIAVFPGAAPATAQTPPSPQLPTLPNAVPVCGVPARVESARCHSWRRTDHGGRPTPQTATTGPYGPTDLQSAYGVTTSNLSPGTGPVVAIVDAYHHAAAESDLNQYRTSTFSVNGVPVNLGACTTANTCFRQVNQNGGSSSDVPVDTGWAQEIALDIEMVSAICPNCKILLVEANSNSYADLGAAVNYAATQAGVVAISNSYGGGEFSFESSYEGAYNHPGIAVTVSSGDAGYGAQFPAASSYVTAVGGTSLTRNTTANTTWSETVWSSAGSGCSRFIAKPKWQTDTGCGNRTVADVAAVADPSTGVTVIYNGTPWVFGGTSVASPIIASVYALAANAGQNPVSYLYGNATGNLYDVTSGSNGRCARKTAYLCTGVSGYDGPTGLGTPRGIGAF